MQIATTTTRHNGDRRRTSRAALLRHGTTPPRQCAEREALAHVATVLQELSAGRLMAWSRDSRSRTR